ncbi:hypothetical protein IID62_05415 [candidate division KSB1 bacterium]|nr:hypothetical protein [candidate division KSB1 bacterium]
MDDIDVTASADQEDESLSDDYREEEETGISFDDIVSFTMLVETSVTLIGIIIFLIFFVL